MLIVCCAKFGLTLRCDAMTQRTTDRMLCVLHVNICHDGRSTNNLPKLLWKCNALCFYCVHLREFLLRRMCDGAASLESHCLFTLQVQTADFRNKKLRINIEQLLCAQMSVTFQSVQVKSIFCNIKCCILWRERQSHYVTVVPFSQIVSIKRRIRCFRTQNMKFLW